jgi:hypothetical protein
LGAPLFPGLGKGGCFDFVSDFGFASRLYHLFVNPFFLLEQRSAPIALAATINLLSVR